MDEDGVDDIVAPQNAQITGKLSALSPGQPLPFFSLFFRNVSIDE
jgi:hypothetical protein